MKGFRRILYLEEIHGSQESDNFFGIEQKINLCFDF